MRWSVLGLVGGFGLACGGRPGLVSDAATSDASSQSQSDSSAGEQGEASTSPTEEGPEAGESGVGPCSEDGDCGPGMLCLHEACQTDCGQAKVVLEVLPAHFLWVIDRSVSMSALQWDHDGQAETAPLSRWAQAHAFITEVSTQLEWRAIHSAILFPSPSACSGQAPDCFELSACESSAQLDLAPGDDALTSIEKLADVLPPADASTGELRGGSPARAALELAIDAAMSTRLDSGDFVFPVLVTDGATNCSMESCNSPQDCQALDAIDPDVMAMISNAASAGIGTFVVGVDARSAHDSGFASDDPFDSRVEHLNELASEGGMAQPSVTAFWHADEPEEFLSQATTRGAQIESCEFDLTMAPNSPPSEEQIEFVEVFVGPDDSPLAYRPELTLEACEQETDPGWIWSEYGTALTLCGPACDVDGPSFEMRVIYGCG